MKYELLSEIVVSNYYVNTKTDAYKLVDKIKKHYKQYGFIELTILYLGFNYDNKIKYDYRLSVEIKLNYFRKAKL